MLLALSANVRGKILANSSLVDPASVFNTNAFTGTGSAFAVNNGQDFAANGGLLIFKNRSNASAALQWFDSLRGAGNYLTSHNTGSEGSGASFGWSGMAFNANGYTVPSDSNGSVNGSTSPMVCWSFLRKAKFFDIVTYTGDGTSNRQIAHNLGVTPGMVIIKRRDASTNWLVSHVSLGTSGALVLEQTSAKQTLPTYFPTDHTSTKFVVGSDPQVNLSGGLFVAYLFAHDTSTSGIIQCGQIAVGSTANLGWKPQFLLAKSITAGDNWVILDTSRGWGSGVDAYLAPNLTNAEASFDFGSPTATGFTTTSNFGTGPLVYMAIREVV